MRVKTRYSVSRKPHRCVHCGHAMERMPLAHSAMAKMSDFCVKIMWRCRPCKFDAWEFKDGSVVLVPWKIGVGQLKGLLVASRQEKKL